MAWLNREMVCCVVDEHIARITNQHATGETTRGDGVEHVHGKIAYGDQETTGDKRGYAYERGRCLVVGVV